MSNKKVIVVDYGAGNLLNVERAVEKVHTEVSLTSDVETLLQAKYIVLPGVGAFHIAMQQLSSLGLVDALIEASKKRIPILGICLGMQLLLDESDEFGITHGLGIIPGRVISIPKLTSHGKVLKIPHIGWDELVPISDESNWRETLLKDYSSKDAVYFVHSYMADPLYSKHKLANIVYGGHKIPAVIARNNVVGCQFHPEKSGNVGLKILRNFLLQ